MKQKATPKPAKQKKADQSRPLRNIKGFLKSYASSKAGQDNRGNVMFDAIMEATNAQT